MGNVSFALAKAAEAAGAVITRNARVTEIVPGDAVILEDGSRIRARTVISNADPRTTLGLLADAAPMAFAHKVREWRMEGPVLKINCALSRLPTFTAASADDAPHRAMVTIARSLDETQAAYERSRAGEPAPRWAELYFHSAYDPSVAPPGQHVMSVFAQYAPYTLTTGSWDDRREAVADEVFAEIARFAPDVVDCVVARQVLAPPDIERAVGLAGGHIFQGECLPDQMWDRRFSPRTGIAGLYMCGASTHPGGSVMAINGRNCAMALLADVGVRPS
jgi:phytoene dehydrogenase-like protein